MATTTAKTKKDVDEMSAKDRLYDSLSYTYGKRGEKIAQEYNKAYSQADRQALSRGMQRSSYTGQTLAGVNQQKINALEDNESALIADYENRLAEQEDKDRAADQWERQFAEGQRQYNESLAYNRERAAASDEQWNKQFGYQKERDTVADTQWQKQLDEQTRQFNEQLAYNREENAANRAFTTSEREAQQEYNTQERLAQQGYNTAEREAQQAYNTQERLAQQEWQAGQNQANRDAELALQKLNQAFQANENALSRQAQKDLQILQQEFTAQQNRESQAWQSNENRLSREAQEALQRLEQEFASGENAKNRDAQLALQQLSQAFTAEQNALNRAESRYEYDTNLQYQKSRDQIADNRYVQETAYSKERDKISDERYAEELAYNRAFAEKQWEEQVSQWNAEFGYNKMSNEQKIAYNYLTTALQLGADVSDELLDKAGLTREDYKSMLKQSQAMLEGSTSSSSSGSSSRSYSGGSENTPDNQNAAKAAANLSMRDFSTMGDYMDAARGGFESADDFYAAKEKGITNSDDWKAYKLAHPELYGGETPAETEGTPDDTEETSASESQFVQELADNISGNLKNAGSKAKDFISKAVDTLSGMQFDDLDTAWAKFNGNSNSNNSDQDLAYTNRPEKIIVGEGKGPGNSAEVNAEIRKKVADAEQKIKSLEAQLKKATTATVREDLEAQIADLKAKIISYKS